MIIPATYENLQVTHEGTMSKRAYYIPASALPGRPGGAPGALRPLPASQR